MPSKKKLQDLEYNVFKKDLDYHKSSDDNIGIKDSGCLSMIATVIVFILVIVVVVGFVQVGRNSPALTCAAPGCSNRLKPGSNYCWLHSNTSNAGRSGGGGSSSSSSSSSGNGSVIGGGGSSSSSSSSETKRNKIWGGSGSNKSNSSSSSSSSSSSGGSSIGN